MEATTTAGGWPAELLDARALAPSHDWGFEQTSIAARAKVIAGCSAHNACLVVWGSPAGYDDWGAASDGDWSFSRLEPYLRRPELMLRTRAREESEIGRWDRALLEAASAVGFERLDDIDDPAAPVDAGTFPVNARGPVRWNTAFAYLDEARPRGNLTIVANALIDRLEVRGGRAHDARILIDGEERTWAADTVVLSAGTYGSPTILMRSGIGPEAQLRRLGIPVLQALPGVGHNLVDHCGSWMEFEAGSALQTDAADRAQRGQLFQAVTVVKAASEGEARGSWDLHLLAWTEPRPGPLASTAGDFQFFLSVKILKPRSRGRLQLRSQDPRQLPDIQHGFLTRSEDLAALNDGLRLARRLSSTSPLADLCRGEISPGGSVVTSDELARHARTNLAGYFHPVGTCRMGPASDPGGVVGRDGRVHGVENLHVADASIMPTIPRADTNLTVVAVAERLAEQLG